MVSHSSTRQPELTVLYINQTDILVYYPVQLSCTVMEAHPFQVLKMNKLHLNDLLWADLPQGLSCSCGAS